MLAIFQILSQDIFSDRPRQEGLDNLRHGVVADGSAPGLNFNKPFIYIVQKLFQYINISIFQYMYKTDELFC